MDASRITADGVASAKEFNMTERLYNKIWKFTVEHLDDAVQNDIESRATTILKLFQESEEGIKINIGSAEDTEEIYQCIRDAILYGKDEIFR